MGRSGASSCEESLTLGFSPHLVTVQHAPVSSGLRCALSCDANFASRTFSNGVAIEAFKGRSLTIFWGGDQLPSSDKKWLIFGWGAALIALQQGKAVLHGSCATVFGQTIALLGRSGGGKSTTAVALSQRGHDFIVDDVTVMSADFSDSSVQPVVYPFQRPVNLTEDAVNLLGLAPSSWDRMETNPLKGGITIASTSVAPRRLDAIVVLEPNESLSPPSMEPLSTISAFDILVEHAGREGAAPQILGQDTFQRFVAHTARTVPALRISRPHGKNTIGAVVDLIEELALKLASA